MKASFLPDRGVIKLSGDDARHFLNGLITVDMKPVQPGFGRFGALLTPQGKIIADFFITEAPAEDGGGFLLDCALELAKPLTDKLTFYKLRSKVLVENLSDRLGVVAAWDGEMAARPELAFADPRNAQLGWRILVPPELVKKTAELIGATMVDGAAYEAHRIACGAPSGGIDFSFGNAFPHDANMDRLHGVDFNKGCFVGQEVVARMQHRGSARTRTVRIVLDGEQPQVGTDILAGDKSVGTMGSSAEGVGLALIRIDRVADALEASLPLLAGGVAIRLADPTTALEPPTRTVSI